MEGNFSLIKKVAAEALLSNFRRKICHLILHVTNRCSMRCRHCFNVFDGTGKELALDEFKLISRRTPDLIWLDIGGGEPLLRDDLEEIVSLFKFKEVSIPSNGWDAEKIVARFERINDTVQGKLVVTLSLDGMKKTHDEIRRPGSFDRTIRAFRGLKKVGGLRVKFNTVLCEKNCDEILDLMNFVKELMPDFHSILMLRGPPADSSMRLPSIERIESLRSGICRIQRSYDYGRRGILADLQRNYQEYKREITSKILSTRSQVIPCLAGRSHLVVWADGGISPCELLPAVGNMREKDLEEILNGADLESAIFSIKNGNCFCAHECNMIENILFSPKSYSGLIRAHRNAR